MAGTTRDAIDTLFERNGKKYTIIDTAGIRKKRSVDDDVEYYSNMRAFDAVRRSDVCALVVDANEGLTEQDVKIIGYVHEQGKPSVIVMNKWDLVEKDTHTVNKFEEKLQNDLKFMSYYKSLYISAKTGQRAEKLLSLCDEVYAHAMFPRSHGRAQRSHRRRGASHRAAFLPRQKNENLLFFAGERLSAYVCAVRERRRADAFLVRAVPRKRDSRRVRFFGYAD